LWDIYKILTPSFVLSGIHVVDPYRAL